jgi:hypothetical protein
MRVRANGSELVSVHHTACRPSSDQANHPIVVTFNLFVALGNGIGQGQTSSAQGG